MEMNRAENNSMGRVLKKTERGHFQMEEGRRMPTAGEREREEVISNQVVRSWSESAQKGHEMT